jgi:hypothetical protein
MLIDPRGHSNSAVLKLNHLQKQAKVPAFRSVTTLVAAI